MMQETTSFLHKFCAFVCAALATHTASLRRRKEQDLSFFSYKKRHHSLQILLHTYKKWNYSIIVPFFAARNDIVPCWREGGAG